MPESYLTLQPHSDGPSACLEWFSEQTVRQEVVEYAECEDLYMPGTPYVESATGCIRFRVWDNCAGGEGSDGLYRVGEPYLDTSTGCVKVRLGWEDVCRCEPQGCVCEPMVFHLHCDPEDEAFFGLVIDVDIAAGQTIEDSVSLGDYWWEYRVTCELIGEGWGPCLRDWTGNGPGCIGFCNKCTYEFTVWMAAHGPGIPEPTELGCYDIFVHAERSGTCCQPDCVCPDCKLGGVNPGTEELWVWCEWGYVIFTVVSSEPC